MSVFTEPEIEYLSGQRLARLSTASAAGQPDVSPVGFSIDGDDIVSGGLDLTKTVRYRHLRDNPVATIVIDDLATIEPWRPRGVKVRGQAVLEDANGSLQVRIHPSTIWSWGINTDAPKYFANSIEKRSVER